MAPSAGSPAGAARAGRLLGAWLAGASEIQSVCASPLLFAELLHAAAVVLYNQAPRAKRYVHASYQQARTTISNVRGPSTPAAQAGPQRPACRHGIAERRAHLVRGGQQPMPDPFASRHVACVAEAAKGTYVAARTSTAANAACKAQWMRAAAKPRQRLPVPGPSPLTLWCGVCCACVDVVCAPCHSAPCHSAGDRAERLAAQASSRGGMAE